MIRNYNVGNVVRCPKNGCREWVVSEIQGEFLFLVSLHSTCVSVNVFAAEVEFLGYTVADFVERIAQSK